MRACFRAKKTSNFHTSDDAEEFSHAHNYVVKRYIADVDRQVGAVVQCSVTFAL